MKKAAKKLTTSEEKTFEILEQAQSKFEKYLRLSNVNNINEVLKTEPKGVDYQPEYTLHYSV